MYNYLLNFQNQDRLLKMSKLKTMLFIVINTQVNSYFIISNISSWLGMPVLFFKVSM